MKSFRIIIAAALAVGSASVMAQGQDPNLGRNLAATCANCHGTNGQSLGGIESINKLPKERLLQKIREFKSGDKPATIMHQIAKGYSDAQMDLIATYLAAQ